MEENKKIDIDSLPRYSFSKISSFENCRYGFFKHYYEGENGLSHGMSEFGSYMHEILENYEKGNLSVYEMLPYYEKYYNDNVVSDFTLKMSENFSRDFSENYYESGKEYLTNFEGFNDFKILEAEYEFNTVINDMFVFNGKIDLIAEDKNGDLIIIDHKSKANFKSKAELHKYARQLYLYSYATHEKYGKFPKIMYFNRFRKNEWTEVPFVEEDYKEAVEWAIKNVEIIENCMDFYPCPLCVSNPNEPKQFNFFAENFCQFRDVCDVKNGGDIINE